MLQDHELVWTKCLELIQQNISTQTYVTWFKPIIPTQLNSKMLTLQLPSQFFFEFLGGHYADLLKRTLNHVLGDNAEMHYIIASNERP